MPSTIQYNPRFALYASICSILTVSFLIVIKTYAYFVSDSIAILGTLIDSIVDAKISIMLFFVVKLSLKPATKKYRHGYGKIEGISAILQSALMAGAGLFLALTALESFLSNETVTHHKLSIIVAFSAAFLSMMVFMVQKYALKRAPSLAIKADHAHYKTDVFLNIGVALSLMINFYTGYSWIDPLFAAIIAIFFINTAYQMSRESLSMLMDMELTNKQRVHLEQLIISYPGVYGVHDLRTRISGMVLYISFDVEMPSDMSVKESHTTIRQLNMKILEYFPNAEVIIHVDPIGDIEDPRHPSY